MTHIVLGIVVFIVLVVAIEAVLYDPLGKNIPDDIPGSEEDEE